MISSQAATVTGNSTLTLAGNNTLTSLTFNNNGGTAAPTLSPAGILTVANGTITASSNNPATNATLSGGTVNLNDAAAPSITVNPITFNGQNIAPLQPTLTISSVLTNASHPVAISGGGNLQLSGANTFTGGVNLADGTNLTIAASSANDNFGNPTAGPVGTGTLNVGANSTLYSTGAFALNNNVVAAGSVNFDTAGTAAASLTLGAAKSTFALPANGSVTMNVISPNMTATLNSLVSGSGTSLTKTGLGTLNLTNANTFSGGVNLNAGTLVGTGVTPFGTGTLTMNGGVLQLRSNFSSTLPNDLVINNALTNAFIDINNAGAGTGNTFAFNALNFSGFTAGQPAPATIVNVTGGNNYRLQFLTTNLGGATTRPTFNVGSGLTVILPGGFSDFSRPLNLGTGSLAFSGTNTFTGNTTVSSMQILAPQANLVSQPLGSGATVLTTGSTLQITPLANLLSSTGYTPGGVTGRFKRLRRGAGAEHCRRERPNPGGVARRGPLGDSNISNHPAIVTGSGAQVVQDMETYTGLLKVTTGGTYTFGLNKDDQMELVVDGMVMHLGDGAGGTARR